MSDGSVSTGPIARGPVSPGHSPAGSPAIPTALVCGFLGSGKTTLLRHLARRLAGRRIAFLVNEISSRDIDAALLEEVAGEVTAVPGGSIFCRCLVSRFIEELRALAERQPPFEGLVVEASGVADPRVVHRMLAETRLDARYRLACVAAVVDPGQFLKLVRTLPNIRAQVEAADIVLINKADLYPEETLRAAEEEILRIRPDICARRTVRGETGRGETGGGETGGGETGGGETVQGETGRGETGRGDAQSPFLGDDAGADGILALDSDPRAGGIPFLAGDPEGGGIPLLAGDPAIRPGGYAERPDPAFQTREVSPGEVRDVEGFRRKLEAISDDVYRVKGFIRSGSGLLLVDSSGGRVAVGPSPVSVSDPVLVFVLRPGISRETASFLDRLGLGLGA